MERRRVYPIHDEWGFAGLGYFSLMGVQPLLGRDFLPGEQIEGKDQVVILGYGLWQRRFAQDPSIIGEKIILSGRPYTVVGVLPRDFPFLPSTLVDGRTVLSSGGRKV